MGTGNNCDVYNNTELIHNYKIKKIVGSNYCTIIIGKNNNVYLSGKNIFNNDNINYFAYPVYNFNIKIKKISISNLHIICSDNYNNIYSAGNNEDYQLGLNDNLYRYKLCKVNIDYDENFNIKTTINSSLLYNKNIVIVFGNNLNYNLFYKKIQL